MIFKNNFIKFLIIWSLSTIINYLFFVFFYRQWLSHTLSSWIGYILWLLLWYLLNKNYNFYLKKHHNTLIKYFFLYLINLWISLLFLNMLVWNFFINVYIANFLILIYTTLSNYIWLKYYVFKNKALLSIWISWDSWSWKTTLANLFAEILWENNCSMLNWDSCHKWERDHKIWRELTQLNPKWNNLSKEKKDLKKIINWLWIKRRFYDHSNWKFTKTENIESRNFIIYDWLHWLDKDLKDYFNLKIFIESDKQNQNKIDRDIFERNRDRKKLLKTIEKRTIDYDKYIFPQKENANIILNLKDNNTLIYLIDWIDKTLESILKKIKWLKINKNEIVINQDVNYDIPKNVLDKNNISYIFDFNKDLIINNSYKWVIKIIFIYIIKKYASNNPNGMNMKKI